MTDLWIDPDLRSTDEGDHDRFSHFVRKDQLTRALVEGTAVVALCGKKWVPSRDPQKFPTCPACAEIMGMIPDTPSGGGSDN